VIYLHTNCMEAIPRAGRLFLNHFSEKGAMVIQFVKCPLYPALKARRIEIHEPTTLLSHPKPYMLYFQICLKPKVPQLPP
jgi:hypothetical protein